MRKPDVFDRTVRIVWPDPSTHFGMKIYDIDNGDELGVNCTEFVMHVAFGDRTSIRATMIDPSKTTVDDDGKRSMLRYTEWWYVDDIVKDDE